MRSTLSGWEVELAQWLKPFLDRLGHKARRRMCPLYVAGLIGPGDRKSIGPMAERMAPGDYDQLHHFVSDGVWDEAPLELELAIQADKLVGGADAVLVVDDTTLPKKGRHSIGVAPQYASALGKTANCQTLVSLTLARERLAVWGPEALAKTFADVLNAISKDAATAIIKSIYQNVTHDIALQAD